jgi:uncharacterized peroxidase-related enzyme
MPRLKAVDPSQAGGKAKQLLDEVQANLGRTPNVFRTLANSSAALEAYLDFSDALGRGSLDAKLREQIAVAVAEANSCEYCLSAHTAIGKLVGLNENELLASRQSKSDDPRTDAALNFAHEIVVRRGELGTSDVEAVRAAGYSDGEIAEIIANVALNVFTNYFNLVAQTEVDFPKVPLASKKSAV